MLSLKGTAGILEGFAGAGASHTTLLTAATSATIAGMLGASGSEWAEAAAEREAHLSAAAASKRRRWRELLKPAGDPEPNVGAALAGPGQAVARGGLQIANPIDPRAAAQRTA